MQYSYIYVITNKRNGTLYIGVTSNLPHRISQHKSKTIKGFSSKYNLTKLVYYEKHSNIMQAIKREKNLKNWKRLWKLNLIESFNPEWKDLYFDLF
ncbi:MAG: GIY-YIG nuclease family protein [Gammaproteobacteria bacterium]|nr:GIY-YIG nuclease family protein [Gammaproteobacteria bacterium]